MSKIFLSIGAGPGIGLATAQRFARDGFEIVLAARNSKRLQGLAAKVEAAGGRVQTRSVDATNVTHSGKATRITPTMRIACARKVSPGRFSTI